MIKEEAKKRIYDGEASIVVVKEDKIVYETKGNGVAPLLKLVQTDPGILEGASVVDKIVGKAAAVLLTLCKAAEVYAVTLSKAGKDYLEKNGIKVSCDKCIEMIENRQRNGMCPFEMSVKDIDDPEEGCKAIAATLQRLINNADRPA
ncbi:MAG: DUF1893 domain-containing protein [Lachnospiraceae bacterium]|nr:DUF1893 domain-containing protein [Lachnospiraceae bacterium]